MKVVDEHIIIQKILNGDVYAFEEIVLSFQDMVYTLSYRILKNKEDAEETAQDVFVKVFSSLKSFSEKSKLSTWIYRITYNTAINKLRSVKRQFDTIEIDNLVELHTHSSPDALTELNSKEKKEIINQSILRLPENDRVIITLYYYEELSLTEIAEIVGISKQNVKVKLYRCRQKLYAELKDKIDQQILDYEYS